MADSKQAGGSTDAVTQNQESVTVNFQPKGDLRKTITWILTNKQREDLRQSLGRPAAQKEGVRAGPKKITKRSVKIIKIVPKRKVSEATEKTDKTDKAVSSSVNCEKVKSVVVPVFKTPMNKKKCNRCKERGHINRMCPQNPKNKVLIPPPPQNLLIESEDAGLSLQLHPSAEEIKELGS